MVHVAERAGGDAALGAGLAGQGPHRRRREVLRPSDWLRGPGDDGAVVTVGGEDGGRVRRGDPAGLRRARSLRRGHRRGAHQRQRRGGDGCRAGRHRRHDRRAGRDRVAPSCDGMRFASELYDVPVVGGHLTHSADRVALSAFALGRCPGRRCRRRTSRPGSGWRSIACLEGRMRADFPFFPSFDERGRELAGDVRLLADLAADGAVGGGEGRQHGRAVRLAGDAAGADPAVACRSTVESVPVPGRGRRSRRGRVLPVLRLPA